MDRGLAKEFLLEASPNPERTGCPAPEILKALAERDIRSTDVAALHLASCSECYAEFCHYQADYAEAVHARCTKN